MTPIASTALTHNAIRHGFFTRQGGVSQGIYASLNCGLGSKDDRGHVMENRRRIAEALSLRDPAPITVHQQHTNTVAVVDESWTPETRPVADGMVTRRRGAGLGILTADCAPVLLADTEAGVIGAAHAGWRGAHTGVLENAIAAMVQLGARKDRIHAAIGPCIGQDAYQVGDEFVATFVNDDPAYDRFFSSADTDGRRHFDLTGYVVHRLTRAGIGALDPLGLDTCADETRFFSYRRTTLRKEGDYGRQISVIALTP
jgi:YfiH family protein